MMKLQVHEHTVYGLASFDINTVVTTVIMNGVHLFYRVSTNMNALFWQWQPIEPWKMINGNKKSININVTIYNHCNLRNTAVFLLSSSKLVSLHIF